MDERLLRWARLPGPRKVLAAARRRLEAGHGLGGGPLQVDLTPGERSEVGRLLGMSWERSGRAVGAKALTRAAENYGATMTDLLAVTGDPVRDLRAVKESARHTADRTRGDGTRRSACTRPGKLDRHGSTAATRSRSARLGRSLADGLGGARDRL